MGWLHAPVLFKSMAYHKIMFGANTSKIYSFTVSDITELVADRVALWSIAGRVGNVRPAGHMRPAKPLNVSQKTSLTLVYMDMYWPGDILIVLNVAREAWRVAHP